MSTAQLPLMQTPFYRRWDSRWFSFAMTLKHIVENVFGYETILPTVEMTQPSQYALSVEPTYSMVNSRQDINVGHSVR